MTGGNQKKFWDNFQFDFKEQVGDIYYIENGDDYILDGKLNTALFETEDELFM